MDSVDPRAVKFEIRNSKFEISDRPRRDAVSCGLFRH